MANPLWTKIIAQAAARTRRKTKYFLNPLFSLVFVQWQWAKWSRRCESTIEKSQQFISNWKWCLMGQAIRYGTQHNNDSHKKKTNNFVSAMAKLIQMANNAVTWLSRYSLCNLHAKFKLNDTCYWNYVDENQKCSKTFEKKNSSLSQLPASPHFEWEDFRWRMLSVIYYILMWHRWWWWCNGSIIEKERNP